MYAKRRSAGGLIFPAERRGGTDTDTSFIGEREIDTFSKGPPTFRSTVYIAFSHKRGSKWSGTRTCNKPLSPRFYYRVRSPIEWRKNDRFEILNPFFPRANLVSLRRVCYDSVMITMFADFALHLLAWLSPSIRITVHKENVSPDKGRDMYAKFMMEPMWKHLDENYYVVGGYLLYAFYVLQFEHVFER